MKAPLRHRPEPDLQGKKLVRAFLAVPLPPELLVPIQAIQKELAGQMPGIRWVTAATMHLTLKFFGDVTEEVLDKIGDVMLSVGRSHPAFQVRIAGVGAFPGPTRVRVVWLGISEGEKLIELCTVFDRELQAIGIPSDERPFSPHLTLGRSRQPASFKAVVPESFRHVDCGSLPVEQVVLFRSQLGSAGAIHHPLKTVCLGRSPAC